jgi:hypothetical protein
MFTIKLNYYDGHYIDSGLSQEERDKISEEALKADEELEDWPEIE